MKKKIYFIITLIILISAYYTATLHPSFIESVYSEKIYRVIINVLSFVFGYLPFSFAELLILLLPVFIIIYLVSFVIKLTKAKNARKPVISKFLKHVLSAILIVCISFQMLWGINYHRLKFSKIANYKTSNVSNTNLKLLCLLLIDKTNQLKTSVNQDNNQIMKINSTKSNLFYRANKAYEKIYKQYPALSRQNGNPKNVKFSHLLSYIGITGFYCPFTGEANINTSMPDVLLPHTTCHEIAHQCGFSREDEANFLGYLACKQYKDVDFQYSGYFNALDYSMNALYQCDNTSYLEIKDKISPAVKKDFKNNYTYWKKFEGSAEKLASKANDTYLKANSQNDGVKSYGRMVDLLIFEYNENTK